METLIVLVSFPLALLLGRACLEAFLRILWRRVHAPAHTD